MSAIDCRRVRNPSVLQQQQRVLSEPNKTKKLRELSSAWTLLGETKSSLNELDEKLSSESLSSQRKNRGREEHHRNKPHSVSFQTSAQSPDKDEEIYHQPALNSSAYLESANHSPSVLPSSSSSSPRHSNSTAVLGSSRSKRSPPKSGAEGSTTTTGVSRNTHHYIPRTSVTTTVVRKTTSLPETTDSNISLSKARVALLKARLDRQKRDLESRRSTTSVRSLSPGVSSDPTLGNTQTRPSYGGSIKRKVAVAPPPRTYAGFSTSSTSKPPHSSKTAMSFSRNTTSKPATTSHPPVSQRPTHTSRSTVAPSSWRSGRQLANQFLGQEVDPKPPHMSDGYSSSTSSLSPPPSRRSPTHRPVTKNLNAATLLSDIRRVEKEIADDVSAQQPRGVTKKPEFTSGRYHRYDPETVKMYMQQKENERKRKAKENMLAQKRKDLDMNLRLLELQRTQKRVLNTNLLSQKTKSDQQREKQLTSKKSAASLAKEHTYPTQSHRVTSSRSHPSPPTTYHRSSPPRTSLYTSVSAPHTSTSPRQHLQATSSHLQTTTSPRHQPLGSPRQHDRSPVSRSPASPRPTSQPPASPHTSPRLLLSASPPPSSPRPVNISAGSLSSSTSSLGSSSSSSSSPSRSLPLHALPSRALVSHSSPVRDAFPAVTITEAVSSLPSAVTTSTAARSHAITVVTSSQPQTVSLTPSLITSTRSTTDVQFADHSPQARVRLTFSSPPSQNIPSTSDLAAFMPPPPVPVDPIDPSLQKLQAIKQSALLLKQKIALEKQRLLVEKQKRQKAARFTLPGAENDPVLASLVKRINDKEAAATKIQAVWRGHRVRVTRSVTPKPSSPIASTASPHTLSPAVTVSRLPHLLTNTAPPTQVQTPPNSLKPQIPPWEQAGGDKLSVINIFTRHQQPPPPEVKVESTTPPSSLHYTASFDDDQSTIRSSPSLSVPAGRTPSPTPTQSPSALSPLLHDKRTPSPVETASSEEEEQKEGVSVITPPGSSSFCSAYVPTENKPVETPTVTEEPRYSPHSLEVQMRAHLNALDTVGEGIRQLDKLERTRDACRVQQESLSITHLIQSQRRTELEAINTETKQELDKTHKRIDKLEQDVQDRFETEKLALEQSRQKDHALPVTTPPYISTAERAVQTTADVQKPRTPSSVSTASSSQVTPISIKTPTPVTTHSVATPSAVDSSISTVISDSTNATSSINTTATSTSIPATLFSSVEENNYPSDFDPTTTIHEDSLEQEGTPVVEVPMTVLSPTVTSSLLSPLPTNQPLLSPHPSGGSTDSATPVPSEYERKDEEEEAAEENRTTEEVGNRTLTAQSVSEMLSEFDNKDQEEEIEEEISKTSFRELLPSESHRRMVLHGRPLTLSVSSDSDSLLATPAASGEVTPFQGEESFYHFVTRMVQQYVREEEMRGKHQAALLQLREKALQEKTQAELKWLNMKKTHLQDKGADDQMPPLVKREKGLIQKFKHEQAEIKRLKEAHEVASRERRLLLLQQKDIARMRKHTQYYNSKISHFSHHGGHEQSPVSESSSPPSPTVPTSQQEVSEQLSRSFSSSRELLTDISVSSSLPPSPVKPSHATVFSDQIGPESPAMKTLRQITTAEKERKLREREAALKLQRKAAEEVLLAQQELHKKEMQLDKEEEEIKKLIEQAAKYQRRPVLSVSASLPDVATVSPQTATKNSSSVEEVLEDLASSAGYSADTFEDTPEHTPLTTSTPAAVAREPSSDDFLTSDGSEIELRVIRLKKEVKAKEKEMRKAQRDQKKRKKEALRQQEQKLAQQLMAHDSVLKTLSHETPPAQPHLVEDKPQELATQAFIHEKPVESVSTSEIEESMSPIPPGSPDSSVSSASTVVSIPDYLLERSPKMQETEENLTKEEEIEQQFELTDETQTEITKESQNEVTEDLEEELEIEEELELEDDEEPEETPQVLSPLVPPPAEQEDIMASEQIASPQQTSYTSSSFEQPTPEQPIPEQPHPEPSQESPQLSAVSVFSLPPEDEEPEMFYAGQRVLVGDSVEGVVRYYGETGFAPGVWVGIELDEPCGKNDGSVKGHRYFSCLPLHGVYAPPHKVAALITPSSSGMSVTTQEFYDDVITADSLSPRPTENWQQLETPADDDKEELSEIAESISQEEADQIVCDEMHWESAKEEISQNLVRELSDEAFNMIHNKWKEKEANSNAVDWEHYLDPNHDPEFELVPEDDDDDKPDDSVPAAVVEETPEQRAERLREEKANAIADSIVDQLFVSDFNLMHNLSVAHESPPSSPPPPQEEPEPPRPPTPPKEVTPLCFVPGSKPSVDMIAATAWNNLRNVGEATAISKTPPLELILQLCGQPPEHCAESFVYLVYQLAVEIILDDNRQTYCQVGNLSSRLSPKSLTLADVQKSVYRQVTAGQHPPSLPPVKYLHKNTRPGGKPVDFVDSILIRELREEEPRWVDYSQEEKQVKERVADSIMDMLLTETAEIFDSIENKNSQQS